MRTNTSNITTMIKLYTTQIERYESQSTWFAAFSIVCILLTIILSVHLFLKRENTHANQRMSYNMSLSAILLVIPSIITLYLYVFAMNMRKVALYRGYLSFLEDQWNMQAESEEMLFDNEIIGRFFSFKEFLVNGLGPVVMVLFLLFAIVIGFGLSIYFERQLQDSVIKKGLRFMIVFLMVICISFNGICSYYLCTNDSVSKSVTEYCEEQRTGL